MTEQWKKNANIIITWNKIISISLVDITEGISEKMPSAKQKNIKINKGNNINNNNNNKNNENNNNNNNNPPFKLHLGTLNNSFDVQLILKGHHFRFPWRQFGALLAGNGEGSDDEIAIKIKTITIIKNNKKNQ